MKTFNKFILLVLMGLVFTSGVFAQDRQNTRRKVSTVQSPQLVPIPIKKTIGSEKKFELFTSSQRVEERNKLKGKSNHCCTSGICKIGVKDWSCNLTDNTVLEESENDSVFELMSHITLSTSAERYLYSNDPKNKIMGTKKFCSACYEKIFQAEAKDKANYKAEFEAEVSALQNKIAMEGVSQAYKRMFTQHYEQRMYYEKHQKAIDKVLEEKYASEKNKKKREEAILTERNSLLCLPNDHFEVLGNNYAEVESSNCPNAKDNIVGFFKQHEINIKIKDAFSKKTFKEINDKFFKFSNLINNKLAINRKEAKKADVSSFEWTIAKAVDENVFALAELCEKYQDKPNMNDVYDIMVQNKNDQMKKTRVEINKEREVLNQTLMGANLADPTLLEVTRDPTIICRTVRSDLGGVRDFKPFLFNKKKKEEDKADDRHAYNVLKKTASIGCNSKRNRINHVKMLCGDIEGTDYPLKVSIDGIKKLDKHDNPEVNDDGSYKYEKGQKPLTSAQKIALGKIQCEKNVSLINSSDNNKSYNNRNSQEYLYKLIIAEEVESINDHFKSFNNRVKIASIAGKTLSEIFSDKSISDTGKRGLSYKDRKKTSMGEALDNFDKELERPGSFLGRTVRAIFGGKNPLVGTTMNSDSKITKTSSSVSSKLFNTSSSSKSESNDRVSSNTISKNKTQSIFNDYQNDYTKDVVNPVVDYNSQNLMKPVTSQEVLDHIEPEKMNEIVSNIQGKDIAEKSESLMNYLSGKEETVPFTDSTENEKELQKQIDDLKAEIAAERQKRYEDENTSLASQLKESNERINKLEQYISTQKTSTKPGINQAYQNVSSGNGPSENNNRVQSKSDAFDKQGRAPASNIQSNLGTQPIYANNGIVPQSKISGEKFIDIINTQGGQFEYSRKQLVLKAAKSDTEYTVSLDDVVIENGKVKMIKYKNQKIEISKLDNKSKLAIEAFVSDNGTKLLTKELDKAIKLSVMQSPEAKEPGVEVARYIQMLCEMDAGHPKCSK